MYILKSHIENLNDRKINENIKVENKVVYVKDDVNSFKYENGVWYIYVSARWIDLQGGIPSVSYEENPDADIFVEATENENA